MTVPGSVGTGVTASSETLLQTVRRLDSVQKGARGAPAYSRFVNRRLGRFLAALAFRAGLTPNTVTLISGLCTGLGVAAMALVTPSWSAGVAISALLVLGYALDSADGQLARLRGGGSPAGEWLDHMFDAVKIASLHLALAIGMYRFAPLPGRAWLLLPLAFSVVSVTLFFATLLNESLRARHGASTRAADTDGRPSVLRSLVVAPTDYGVLCLVFVVFGAPVVFMTAYGVIFLGTAAYLVLACPRWFREMSRLGSAVAVTS